MAWNESLRGYAEEAWSVPVRLFALTNANGVIQSLLGGALDMAWLGALASAAVSVADEDAVKPVRVKTNLDGSCTYHSTGFARADNGITLPADTEGKSFAFADPNPTPGVLVPNLELPTEGYSMTKGKNFSRISFPDGHEQSITAVANGEDDAARCRARSWGRAAGGRAEQPVPGPVRSLDQ